MNNCIEYLRSLIRNNYKNIPIKMESNEYEKRINDYEKRINDYEKRIIEIEKNKNDYSKFVDNYVENWFEKNKQEVDIGKINIGTFEIDILPDYIEKYMYKKMLRILFSIILQIPSS
jgi:hypothetical protein